MEEQTQEKREFKTYIGQYAGATFEGSGQTKTGKEWQRHKAIFRHPRQDGTLTEIKFTVFPPLTPKSQVQFDALQVGTSYMVSFVAEERMNNSNQQFTAKQAISFRLPYPDEAVGFHQALTQSQQQPMTQPQQLQPQPQPQQPTLQMTQPQQFPDGYDDNHSPSVTQPTPTIPQQGAIVNPVVTPPRLSNEQELKEFAESYKEQVEAGDYSAGHFIGLLLMNKDRNKVQPLIDGYNKFVLGK